MRKYFGCVPLWLSIVISAVLGYFDLVLFIAGLFNIGGLFSPPSKEDTIRGYLLLACIPASIAVIHMTAYFICRKIRADTHIPNGKTTALYTAADIAVFIAAAVLSLSRFW